MENNPGAAAGNGAAEILDDWAKRVAAELGLSDVDLDIAEVLNLAKVAAHSVARPAAPVTTFLAGLAAGRAGGSADDIAAAIQAAGALASTVET